MQLYEQKFENALAFMQSPGVLNPTGDKPICYVTYDVEDVMEIRSLIQTSLKPKAAYYGYTVHLLSINDIIRDFINNCEYKDLYWSGNVPEKDLYDSIQTEINNEHYIEKRILEKQDEIKDEDKPLLVIKDLEMLHPYSKIGAIENIIYNKIEIPIIILYPGSAQGTARTFLNIYTMDGNYRSKNF